MNGDTRIYRYEAEDVVALDRVAALGEFIDYIVDALVDNEGIARLLCGRCGRGTATSLCLCLGSTTLLIGLT